MTDQERRASWPMTMLDVVASYLAVHGAFNLTAATPWPTTLKVFAMIAALSLAVGIAGHVMGRRSQR